MKVEEMWLLSLVFLVFGIGWLVIYRNLVFNDYLIIVVNVWRVWLFVYEINLKDLNNVMNNENDLFWGFLNIW